MSALGSGMPYPRERLWTGFLWAGSLLVAAMLLWPLLIVILEGSHALSLEFFTGSPSDAGRSGGILPILVSTLAIVSISLAAALPLAFAIAVMLTEVCRPDGWIATAMRCSLDILAGVPSVVFGLFGLSLFCRQLGMGYSIAAGGLALACMILPTLARALTTALEAAGEQHRVSGAALGLSKPAVLCSVTVPVALPGICAGLILAMTRALAETAVLLFTSGYSDRMPESIMDSGRSISIHIYDLSTNVPGGMPNAYGSALALLLMLTVLSAAVHWGTRWMHKHMTGASQR
ncbi:phosphate ABC transporter permease PstA [Chitiniphilus purpureus]|uniref:Phosphate transport system permease protein PstA n=1 Tax=Chitiniphilus purpureus TaxID=2981137 RepID=A0ABY6DND7_9NEIS|nr:phosphate ABC transporter permease PstA [Chitiniphilus sp. CD1]UXY15884.1 phosphate ABC transporter permease PstA [Chitiniphilus sp. CD1]